MDQALIGRVVLRLSDPNDVVGYVLKQGLESLLLENNDGSLVVDGRVFDAFRRITEDTVVWAKPDRYWVSCGRGRTRV